MRPTIDHLLTACWTLYICALRRSSRLHNGKIGSRASSPPQHEGASFHACHTDRQAALFCTCQAVLVYKSPLCTTCLVDMLVAKGAWNWLALFRYGDPSLPLLFTANSQRPAMRPWRRPRDTKPCHVMWRGSRTRSPACDAMLWRSDPVSMSSGVELIACSRASCCLSCMRSMTDSCDSCQPWKPREAAGAVGPN
jgi:hypothetical protein